MSAGRAWWRWLAMSGAAGVTVATLALFWRGERLALPAIARGVRLLPSSWLAPPLATRRDPLPRPAHAGASPRRRSPDPEPMRQRVPSRAVPRSVVAEPAAVAALPAAVADPAASSPRTDARAPLPGTDDAAAPPLLLDDATVRRAVAAARSPARRLAESVGDVLDDQPAGGPARLGREVARAAKPDCLAPDPAGSLLSPILIAIAIARDRCK